MIIILILTLIDVLEKKMSLLLLPVYVIMPQCVNVPLSLFHFFYYLSHKNRVRNPVPCFDSMGISHNDTPWVMEECISTLW